MTFLIFLYEQKRKERILMLEQWIKENANMKDRGSVAVINDDVWILPPRCFSNMPGLKKVILPYNLRKIGAFSFAGCRSLEVIDIPRQVVLIDYGAFFRTGWSGSVRWRLPELILVPLRSPRVSGT